ncbi:MAG: hypothetical protein OEM82_05390 [Acidobacteriota bacterium]|nr:hypothetical protein [Acidobacteriota bacterium]MDH3528652.1 hypothetical protein [Acidobacteriota bacterium]
MAKQNSNGLILFFVDGLGIGERKPENPFYALGGPDPLCHFVDGNRGLDLEGNVAATDACLGVEGRPQSASGQTTIYTGINAPKELGYHKQGFPNESLRRIIEEHSIFRQLKNAGVDDLIFANTYTPKFFERKPRWKSATTCAVEAAGMPFCSIRDLLGRRSLFHDFTNRTLIKAGHNVPEFTPRDGAEILAGLCREYSFVLYEHFITDKIGHDMDWERAKTHLPELAELIRETLQSIDLEYTTFVLTSDHGNIEDLSIRNHTRNKVPTVVWGRKKEVFASRISSLADITPAILDLLT